MRHRHRTRWECIDALPFDASREPRSGIVRIMEASASETHPTRETLADMLAYWDEETAKMVSRRSSWNW